MTGEFMPKQHILTGVAILSGFALFLLLLSGCGSLVSGSRTQTIMAQDDDDIGRLSEPPKLLGSVDAEYGVRRGILLPNHQAYFLGETGISAIDGVSRARRIPLPDLTTRFGWDLTNIAREPMTGLVYVDDWNENAIHVISETVVITTMLGDSLGSPRQLVADEDDGEIYAFYVTHRNGTPEQRALVISGTEVVTDILLLRSSNVARYNPVDGRIYIASNQVMGSDSGENALLVIDDHELITELNPLSEPYASVVDLAIDPHTGDINILLTDELLFWDRVHGMHSIDLYGAGYGNLGCLTIDPVRSWTYVCAWTGRPSHVLVVNQDELIAEILVEHWPEVAAYDTTHDYLYVAHYDPTYLSVIRGTELITTIDIIGYGTMGLLVDEERGYIYVANADGGTVSVFGFDEPATPSWRGFLPWIQ